MEIWERSTINREIGKGREKKVIYFGHLEQFQWSINFQGLGREREDGLTLCGIRPFDSSALLDVSNIYMNV